MKNLATILKAAALAVATLAMSSCVVNDNEPFNNEPQAIGFNAVVGPISDSRAVITDLNYPNDLPFAAFASQLGDGKTWDTNKAEAVQLIGGDAVAYQTYLPGKWTTEVAYYWPDFGSLTFFAYSPYFDAQGNKINNIAFTPTTGELKVTGWDVSAAKFKDVDLMMADVQKDLTSDLAPSGVPVAFRHKLARVNFRAGLTSEYKEGSNTYKIFLRKVVLKNIYTKGNYSSVENSGRWTELSEPEQLVIYNNATGVELSHLTSATIGADLLVMPQGHLNAASGAGLEIAYFDTKTGTTQTIDIILRHKFPDSNWIINGSYTYMIMIDRGDPDYIEFNPPTVSGDWVDAGTYTLTIE